MMTQKMSKRTLVALEKSIAKWEFNAKVSYPQQALIYDDTCALCDVYSSADCGSCPVKMKTGKPMCIGTPWRSAASSLENWELCLDEERKKTFQKNARSMVRFLKKLLPAPQG